MPPKRILVVDDEAQIVSLLQTTLSEAGFDVDGALNAADALTLVKDNLYDVVIVDFSLPDMNGVMLHSRIRQLDQDLGDRTIFISGVVQSEDDLSYYAETAGGFLPKPFETNDLLECVRKLTQETSETSGD